MLEWKVNDMLEWKVNDMWGEIHWLDELDGIAQSFSHVEGGLGSPQTSKRRVFLFSPG